MQSGADPMPDGQHLDPPPPALRLPDLQGSSPDRLQSALPDAVRIPPDLEVVAAARLVGEGVRGGGGRRMVTAAALHGIDLSLMWGILDARPDGTPHRVRQVCLAVPGSGRTAMLVLSPPGSRREGEGEERDRIASIVAACRGLGEDTAAGRLTVRLAQALPDPRESWAVRAFAGAGFIRVGDLAYLRLPLKRRQGEVPGMPWPEGITVRNVQEVGPGERDRPVLLEALERSYIATLDCPALCGLRETEDILESHRATGIFDPKLWWLVYLGDQPHGCMLMSQIPDHSCVELVYLGLSPELRGRGLGSQLLQMGIAASSGRAADHIACAVDMRNSPARLLYERIGFKETGQRVALVRAVTP
jgi:GNAT superfamily N-acetyltransferase